MKIEKEKLSAIENVAFLVLIVALIVQIVTMNFILGLVMFAVMVAAIAVMLFVEYLFKQEGDWVYISTEGNMRIYWNDRKQKIVVKRVER